MLGCPRTPCLQTMDPVTTLIVRYALALLFAGAALHKLFDRRRFDGIVLDYRLAPPRLALRIARLLPLLELLIAGGLAIPWPPASPAAALLLAGYGLAMAINLVRGRREIHCGCGGLPQRLSLWLVARNAVLAAAAVSLLLPAGMRVGALDVTTLAAMATVAVLLPGTVGLLVAHVPWRQSRRRP